MFYVYSVYDNKGNLWGYIKSMNARLLDKIFNQTDHTLISFCCLVLKIYLIIKTIKYERIPQAFRRKNYNARKLCFTFKILLL